MCGTMSKWSVLIFFLVAVIKLSYSQKFQVPFIPITNLLVEFKFLMKQQRNLPFQMMQGLLG